MSKIALVRVRGSVNLNGGVKDPLSLLRLYRKNYCVVIEGTPSLMGMIKKVKDYITYGEIDSKIHQEMADKRGEEYLGREEDVKGKIKYNNRFIVIDGRKLKPFFRLSPPKGGFGRKGIKVSFKSKGALGYRGSEINGLLKRM